MRIGIDFDGVLADVGPKIRKAVREVFNADIATEDLREHNLIGALGLTEKEKNTLFDAAFSDMEDLEPIWGVGDYVYELLGAGHELQIVTKRHKDAPISSWLQQHDIPIMPVYYMASDQVPPMAIMIDDDPVKLAELDSLISLKSLLFTQPWNEHCLCLGSKIQRVVCWDNLITVISRIKEDA